MAKSKILIGSDFSHHSSVAIEVGLTWAEKFGSDPHVFHINNSKNSSDGLALLSEQQQINVEGILSGLKEDLKEKLIYQVKETGDSSYSKVGIDVLFGKRSELIIKKVNELNAKMLVLGSLGQGGIEDIFLGGTTERAIRSVKCPILAVRDKRAKAPKKILWASDLKDDSDFVFEWLAFLGELFQAKVHIVHMTQGDKTTRSMEKPDEIWDYLQKKKNVLAPKLIEYENKLEQRALKGSCSLEFSGSLSLQNALSKLIDKSDADLVVLGTHGRKGLERFFLGSVAESLTHSVRRSFFIVKSD